MRNVDDADFGLVMQLIVDIAAAGILWGQSQGNRHAGRFASLVLPTREGEIVGWQSSLLRVQITFSPCPGKVQYVNKFLFAVDNGEKWRHYRMVMPSC